MPIIIYLIAFLEGFTTLSVEIVALRLFTPIIGSNSISTSIILGVILLALSYGYYRGGVMVSRGKNIEKKLVMNLLCSALYYFIITFVFYGFFLQLFLQFLGSYFLSILLTSIVLFFVPVFLASQTIPLLSHLLKNGSEGENIGKLLFYSTVGSFVGSVGTSTILFPVLGVLKTAVVSPTFLIICMFLVSRFFLKSVKFQGISLGILGMFLLVFFISPVDTGTLYKKANAYHNVHVVEVPDYNRRIFLLNDAYSSGIHIDTGKSFFSYIKETLRHVDNDRPKNILVIGAAGFTFPQEVSEYDFVERIDVVDVDGSLKDIAETYFLQERLSDKIVFYPEASRYFLNHIERKYDFVFVDVYTGKSLPAQVLTQEFFTSLAGVGENIYLNLILDTPAQSVFSQNVFTTLESVFSSVYYKNVNSGPGVTTNFIVTNTPKKGYIESVGSFGTVYTDDKHSIELDKFLLTE